MAVTHKLIKNTSIKPTTATTTPSTNTSTPTSTSHNTSPPSTTTPTQPPSPAVADANGTDFARAANFLRKLKTQYVNHPQIYQSFLTILHSYQTAQFTIQEVYEQVGVLLQAHPDLLEEFTRFLPNNSQQNQPNNSTATTPSNNNTNNNNNNSNINASSPSSPSPDQNQPEVWNQEGVISLEDAVYQYTLGSAFVSYLEQQTGSIEVGKLADIIILSKDIFRLKSLEDIHTARVILTMIDGEIVFNTMDNVHS